MGMEPSSEILAKAYYKAGISLWNIEPEIRPLVVAMREEDSRVREPTTSVAATPNSKDDPSPWEENAIRCLEDCYDE